MNAQEVKAMLLEIIKICDKDVDPILCLIAIKRAAASTYRSLDARQFEHG